MICHVTAWARQCLVAASTIFAIGLYAFPSEAGSPFIDPGDRLIRQDIELLKAHGVFNGVISTWPMGWKQVERNLANISPDAKLPPHVRAAIMRLQGQADTAADRGIGASLRTQFTNEERIIRDFGQGARDEVDTRVTVDKQFGRGYIRLSAGYREDEFDGDINLDGTVGAVTFANWLVFAGFQDQWFGPGFDTALVLSTNARPPAKIGIQRLDPKRINLPVLRWLGPVQFNFTAGLGEPTREDFDRPLLIFSRFSFEPVYGLQLGVSRGLQLCGGGGRVCSVSSISRALVTVVDFVFQVGGDLDNTGVVLTDPGNQVASLDVRYTNTIGKMTYAGYLELVAEDSAGVTAIGDASLTLGATLSGYSERFGLNWTLRAEASDTEADRYFALFSGSTPGSANQNFIFTDGYTHRDLFIGPSIGTDGRLFTGELSATDRASRHYYFRYRRAILNATALSPSLLSDGRIRFNNLISDNPETVNFLEVGAFIPPTRFGRFYAEARIFDDEPNTPGESDFGGAFELGWSIGF
ncbi:MAG: capsule assembly Wzi family protein [Pseudomonadota bacterium]